MMLAKKISVLVYKQVLFPNAGLEITCNIS